MLYLFSTIFFLIIVYQLFYKTIYKKNEIISKYYNLIFFKLTLNGNNPYHDDIESIEMISIYNNLNINCEEETDSYQLVPDYSPKKINLSVLRSEFSLKDYLLENKPFDGNICLVGYGNEIAFLKNYIKKNKLDIDITYIDNYLFAQKIIKPYKNNKNSWWELDDEDIYSIKKINDYLRIETDPLNIYTQLLIYKTLCKENNESIFSVDKISNLL
jgi:hypothetical protein